MCAAVQRTVRWPEGADSTVRALHLRQSDSAVWLFIDEPDHFVALAEIQPWLTELVNLCEETSSQAIICSNHPELIDYLGPESGASFK